MPHPGRGGPGTRVACLVTQAGEHFGGVVGDRWFGGELLTGVICAEIDEYVQLFLDRRLDEDGTWYPYLWLDATYLDVRIGKRVMSQAVVVATACSHTGRREILGMAVGDTETTDFWTSFLRSLRDRGLKVADPAHGDPTGVTLVISDAHSGLKAAVKGVQAVERSVTCSPEKIKPPGNVKGSTDRWQLLVDRSPRCLSVGVQAPTRRKPLLRHNEPGAFSPSNLAARLPSIA